MSPEEYAAVHRAANWADYITESEWKALLGNDDATPAAKSRLKKKAAGWLVALGGIAVLNPELFETLAKQALKTYEEQTESEYPSAKVATAVWPWFADLVQEERERRNGGED